MNKMLRVAAVVVVLSCDSTTEPTATPASIEFAPADTSMLQDDVLQLTVVVRDSEGAPIPGIHVTYQSLVPQIATVSATGLVRSQGPAGTAVIRAQAGAVDTVTTVTVRDSTRIIRLPLSHRPNFIALKGNFAYITRVDRPWVTRLDLPSTAFSDSAEAGQLPCGVVFNPAGTRAYVANQGDDNISIIDVATNMEIDVIPVHGDPLPVDISLDGNTLFVTTNLDRLYTISLLNKTILDSLDLPATSHHLLVHPNGSLLYVATRDGGSVLEVDWRTMTTVRTFNLGVQTLGMEIAPDRSELYVTSNTNDSLYIVTLLTGAVTTAPVAAASASTIALSADGSRIYVGQLFAGRIDVLDRATRARIKTIRTGGVVREMATDRVRGRIIVTNEDGWVDIVR